MFLNRTLIANEPTQLQANLDYRIKVEHQHTTFSNYHYLEWVGPFSTAQESSSSSSFVVIPDEHYSHAVSCPDGCSGRGCCRADGRCKCQAGYGGDRCQIQLDSCGPDAPSGPAMTGGIMARFFSDRDFTNKVTDLVQDRIYLSYGQRPSGVPRDTFSVRYAGRLLALQTGWHALGVISNSRSRARIIVNGVELYNWHENWSAFMYMTKGESHSLVVELRCACLGNVQNQPYPPLVSAVLDRESCCSFSFSPPSHWRLP